MKTVTQNTLQMGQDRMNIKEIARVAGVSPATISRVLNGSGYVKEETKKKVMAAVEKNKYTPSLIARSLSGRDSFSIGVILPEVGQKVYSGILEGICRASQPYGYNIVLMNTAGDLKKEHEFLETAENQRMKGLIVAPAAEDDKVTREKLVRLEEQGMPVVLTEGNIKGAPFDCVFGDNWRGAYEGAESLMEAGHKKIAVVRGDWRNEGRKRTVSGIFAGYGGSWPGGAKGVCDPRRRMCRKDIQGHRGAVRGRYAAHGGFCAGWLRNCRVYALSGGKRAYSGRGCRIYGV